MNNPFKSVLWMMVVVESWWWSIKKVFSTLCSFAKAIGSRHKTSGLTNIILKLTFGCGFIFLAINSSKGDEKDRVAAVNKNKRQNFQSCRIIILLLTAQIKEIWFAYWKSWEINHFCRSLSLVLWFQFLPKKVFKIECFYET